MYRSSDGKESVHVHLIYQDKHLARYEVTWARLNFPIFAPLLSTYNPESANQSRSIDRLSVVSLGMGKNARMVSFSLAFVLPGRTPGAVFHIDSFISHALAEAGVRRL